VETDDELAKEEVDAELLELDESAMPVVFVPEKAEVTVELAADAVVSEVVEAEELELDALTVP